jgi:hypothetical protein
MLENISIFFFIMSILYIIREIRLIVKKIVENNRLVDGAIIEPYRVSNIRKVLTWVSISYIITFLI